MSCLYNAAFVHEISFWVIDRVRDRVIHKCNAGCDSCFTSLYQSFIGYALYKEEYCTCRAIVRILPGYFGGENCISNEYRPTNLLTCSTDMGLLRLCKISEMPQLGWECPGVSYWVWQNFKKEKKKKKSLSGGGGGGGRETDRQRGREEGRTKQKQRKKKIKTLICCNLLSKLWCPIFSPSRVPI